VEEAEAVEDRVSEAAATVYAISRHKIRDGLHLALLASHAGQAVPTLPKT